MNSATAVGMRLHLQYRLWIGAMNADINVLRIFDDYLAVLETGNVSEVTANRINHYKRQFIAVRQELDELRHEMHIAKMKIAAAGRKEITTEDDMKQLVNHSQHKERYKIFRKKFSVLKKEFKNLDMFE